MKRVLKANKSHNNGDKSNFLKLKREIEKVTQGWSLLLVFKLKAVTRTQAKGSRQKNGLFTVRLTVRGGGGWDQPWLQANVKILVQFFPL